MASGESNIADKLLEGELRISHWIQNMEVFGDVYKEGKEKAYLGQVQERVGGKSKQIPVNISKVLL